MSVSDRAAEEIARAKQFDVVGKHDDAINALARAAKLGSLDATTALAKRLIVGDRAPLLPSDGTKLLMDAVNQGGAEAMARLAVLVAIGAYVEPSVDNAFGLLVAAASHGWQPAQQQLLALTPDRELAASVASGIEVPSDYWQQLATTVDGPFWSTAPASQNLCESPLVCAFDDFIPGPVCDWIIEHSRARLQRALVYDAVGGKELADHSRTNTIAQFDLMSTDFLHILVQIRMSVSCKIPLAHMEATAVLHYDMGEQISNHYDFVNPRIPNYREEVEKNGQRILTFLIYLNDDYDGGETEFPELGITHKGSRGAGMLFGNTLPNEEPDLRTVHAGRAPTRGEKWIVSQFVRNRPVLRISG